MIAALLAAVGHGFTAASRALVLRADAFGDRERGDYLDQADVDFAAADADFLDTLNCTAPGGVV
ncbi:hypothetical protein [Mycolicibacterium sp. F2034L]|uniref:hypothetical protein n=1 Tax=Mycolicibacterium sp. F2034L TaxID=2926422 RepID=UPI001FF1F266|nr:hypothetical protein [Mycolicibacterium sp. F2034L]MCK0174771.1 hypothetical protein [Mycolicibacterium sp. F2034L]